MRLFILLSLLSMTFAFENLKNNTIIKHRYYWKDFKGIIPRDAFNVTKNLYIGQVLLDGILVGGYYAGTGAVITEYDGQRFVVRETIKLLCDRRKDNFVWDRVNIYDLSPEKLKSMVMGGFEHDCITYIGKVFHEGQWKIGKVFPPPHPLEGLNVWRNNGRRYLTENFEILKYLDKPGSNFDYKKY